MKGFLLKLRNPFLIYSILVVSLFVFLSCSDDTDGDWDDNIKLSQKTVELPADNSSFLITTEGTGWWINGVSFNGNIDHEVSENASGGFLIESDEFIVDRRAEKEIYIQLSENTTGTVRTLVVGLENGNYFDGISVTQLAAPTN